MLSAATRWGLVVPVKRLSLAKSRLGPPHGPYDQGARQALALAFASDVVSAGVACPQVIAVVVVTDDLLAAATLTALGAQVVADHPDAGHNAALEHGADLARSRFGAAGVASLSADLPCLSAAVLSAALTDLAADERAFVADATGSGTTLLAASGNAPLAPSYGPRSADRHRAGGARELNVAQALRLDVDTPDDLALALALGVGPATAAVARLLGAQVA